MSRNNEIIRTAKEQQYLKQLGDNIRVIRQKMGYSQEEFAEVAGFSRSYYTEIETGKRNISVLNFIKIIEALKIDPKEIIGFFKSK
ncbi:MAG: helix-turn-helix transcriptional regulator [Dehalococcoidales bacterium]|nr:helix-turn-helix transcriptional regulator [Dehalococcoidales bacterium]